MVGLLLFYLMKIELTLQNIDEVIADLGLAPKLARRAVNKLITKRGTLLRKDIVDDIYKAYGIPRRSAQINKVRTKKRTRVGRSNIWIGRNAIKSAYLGRLRQSKAGAFAGAHFFKGAVVRTMASGHTGAFRLMGTKFKEEELELTKTPVLIRQRLLENERLLSNNLEDDLLRDITWLTS